MLFAKAVWVFLRIIFYGMILFGVTWVAYGFTQVQENPAQGLLWVCIGCSTTGAGLIALINSRKRK